MIKIKNFLLFILTICLIVSIFIVKDKFLEHLLDFFKEDNALIIEPGNKYTKNEEFAFVKQEKNYKPYNYDDLVNIYYSILNQGWMEFTFYCPPEYTDCLKDIDKISKDKVLLSDINNYVHPYNSYSTIRTVYDETGEVTVYIGKLYSSSEILKLNEDIDAIIENNINDSMDTYTKIKTLHDYIINNTRYDSECANKCSSTDESCQCEHDSKRMTGALYEHLAICSGYTDLMAVMLEKLSIPNFKIASETHVWNAVYYNNSWLHLDLTWDDPVSVSGEDNITDDFFLKTTTELIEADTKTKDHIFDYSRYSEFK